LHPKVPRENNHPLAQSITTIFTGVYRAMIRLITRFGESLYREVCLLYRNLPEGGYRSASTSPHIGGHARVNLFQDVESTIHPAIVSIQDSPMSSCMAQSLHIGTNISAFL
jgi:hypothetical protein